MKTWSIVRFEFEGVHKWPDAPLCVYYLKNIHRHVFKCEVWVEEKDFDRDVEFISLKQKLVEHIKDFRLTITDSCETIANNILNVLMEHFPEIEHRRFKVFVFEDGENGACIET